MKFAERQQEAKNTLKRLSAKAEQIVLVHYSCESFYDTEAGRTPRITSIACRNFQNGQTRSFSIPQVAELPDFAGMDPWANYDEIERRLLDEFFAFVAEQRAHAIWVHWNMRDVNYGFQAIEHRYRVLGGDPNEISDDKKYDLARIMVARFGKRYTGHPRLESIMRKSLITDQDFLSGADEAKAFVERRFLDLHRSTLRKVDVFANLLELVLADRLKTSAPFWDRNGSSLRLFWEKYVTSPFGKLVATLSFLAVILGLADWAFPDIMSSAQRGVQDFFTAHDSVEPLNDEESRAERQ